jgi:hypothetical protein
MSPIPNTGKWNASVDNEFHREIGSGGGVGNMSVAGGMMMGRASSMTSIAEEYAQLVGSRF